MQRLPPFDALVAFDAVARLASVTRAAREIGVTQSAISHRLRRLEAFMDASLFERRSDGLALNPIGRALQADVADLLSRAQDLRSRCAGAAAPDRLRIGVSAALADNWLVRRLPSFTAWNPGLAVEIAILENRDADAEVDARILWVGASEARATTTQRPLFREHVFPVCAPGLLAASAIGGGPRSLLSLPLLHKQSPGQGAEWDWATWFERLGLQGPPAEAMRFTSIGPTISAALAGAGVALARSMLVCDALADGRLVRLTPAEFDQLSSKVHVLRWPPRHIGGARVRAFADWIASTARETADTPGLSTAKTMI